MLRFVKPHKLKISLALLFLFINGLLKLPVPFLTIYLIDRVIPKGEFPTLAGVAALIVLMSAVFIVSDFIRSYYLFVASKMVFANIQVHLLGHVQKLPISYFNVKDTGYIMSRFVEDAALLNNLVTEISVNFLQNIVIFLIGAVAIFYIHWKLALVSIIILPFFVISNVIYGNRLRELNKAVQEKRAFIIKSLHETLANIFVIKVFSRERSELVRIFKHLKEAIRLELKTFFSTQKVSMVISFIGAMGPLVVLCYGGYEIINHRLTLGQLMGFNSVLAYLYGPSQMLAGI
jgi:subfamily B ATP-binding cassette protein MsbA